MGCNSKGKLNYQRLEEDAKKPHYHNNQLNIRKTIGINDNTTGWWRSPTPNPSY